MLTTSTPDSMLQPNRRHRLWTSNWPLTPHPLGFKAEDTNLRRYVGNSPENATDPEGLQPDGHHWVPQSVVTTLQQLLSQDARKVFQDGKTHELIYKHGFDTWNSTTQGQYNDAVKQLLIAYKEMYSKDSPLSKARAREFLKWVQTGQGIKPEFAKKFASQLSVVATWRAGFIRSIGMAMKLRAKAQAMGIVLTNDELKSLTRAWLNGTPCSSISSKAATVYSALHAEVQAMAPTARSAWAKSLARLGVAALAKVAGVVVITVNVAGSAKAGYQGEGNIPIDGLPGATVSGLDKLAQELVGKDLIEALATPVLVNIGNTVNGQIPPAPTTKRRGFQNGVTLEPGDAPEAHPGSPGQKDEVPTPSTTLLQP